MKVYLGSDHNGFHLKEKIFAYLSKRGYDVEDVGDEVLDPDDDFPQFAYRAAVKILGSEYDGARAILLCGGGHGMCMAANRIRGIRAALVHDSQEAKITRHDNDSNILCLPSRMLEDEDEQVWHDIIDTWLETPFSGAARFVRRNRQLDELA